MSTFPVGETRHGGGVGPFVRQRLVCRHPQDRPDGLVRQLDPLADRWTGQAGRPCLSRAGSILRSSGVGNGQTHTFPVADSRLSGGVGSPMSSDSALGHIRSVDRMVWLADADGSRSGGCAWPVGCVSRGWVRWLAGGGVAG